MSVAGIFAPGFRDDARVIPLRDLPLIDGASTSPVSYRAVTSGRLYAITRAERRRMQHRPALADTRVSSAHRFRQNRLSAPELTNTASGPWLVVDLHACLAA